MAKCTDCGSETELYSSGVPICPKCSDAREAKRKPQATVQQVRSALLQDVLELTARVEEATRRFNDVMQIPSGMPHPDGVQRIKNASSKLSVARDELMKAHRRLDEHIDRGIVPEDLRRSG
jgi:DNA-directed RNA polymerase subunit RPC12/RpoP